MYLTPMHIGFDIGDQGRDTRLLGKRLWALGRLLLG